jgi:Kef-type K+ transport system membrane component KefB
VDVSNTIPELDAGGLRRFGLTTGAVALVLFGVAIPWLFDLALPRWPWALAAVLGLWALLAPASLGPVYRGWMRFGLLMSRVTTPLVLGIVFFLVVTPVALGMRLFRRDPMARGLDPDATTYRVTSHKAPRERMERPF